MATFTNQATLSYRDNITVSNVVTGELQQAVSVTKTALNETYTADSVLTYAITIVNEGATPLTELTLTDNLGAYTLGDNTVVPLSYLANSLTYFVNGVRQGLLTVGAGNTMTITGISVPANGNAFLVYQVNTNDFAPPITGGSIVNTATVSGGGLPAPIEASATVTAETEAFLTVSKSLFPTSVSEGDRLTYTFTIRNFGNTPILETDDATITDAFHPLRSDLTVTFNGQSWTEGEDYHYNRTTGEFSTVPTKILVPAATYTQNPTTGAWTVLPGISTLTVVGTV